MKKVAKKYDVVILTHAPKDDLLASIEMFYKQEIKPQKIILYNTDRNIFTKNISEVSRLKELILKNKIIVKHIDKVDFDHGKARNDATLLCKSSYILFMTDDAVPYDDKLTCNLLKAFEDRKVAVAYARQIAKIDAKLKEKYTREFNYPDKDIVKDKSTEEIYGIKNCFCSNSCAMYSKRIFNNLGKFVTKIVQNEDMLYAYEAIENGYKVVYKADALVFHSHNLNYFEQFLRNRDIGKFQKMNEEIYNKFKSEGEGLRLVKYVNGKLLKQKKYIESLDFNIECFFRYMGYLIGKRG